MRISVGMCEWWPVRGMEDSSYEVEVMGGIE
jgi:hypothetical protein